MTRSVWIAVLLREWDVFIDRADTFSWRVQYVFYGKIDFTHLSWLFVLGVCFLRFAKDGMSLMTKWTLSLEALRLVFVGEEFYFTWQSWDFSIGEEIFLYSETKLFNLTCNFTNSVWWHVTFLWLVLISGRQIVTSCNIFSKCLHHLKLVLVHVKRRI